MDSRAISPYTSAIELYEKAGIKNSLAISVSAVAQVAYLPTGAIRNAEFNLLRSISIRQEIQDEFGEAICHQELGRVLIYRGAWEEAEQELFKAISIKVFKENLQGYGLNWLYRALRFLLMIRESSGQSSASSNQSQNVDLKSSIEAAKHALELADEDARTDSPVPRDYVRAYWLLGAAYRANNDLTLAEENLSKALNLCRQINMVDHEANILLDVARLCYAQGDFKDAQEKASEALMITERSGYVLQGADVNLFLAQYALEQEKDKAKAKAYAEEAKKLATCDGGEYKYKVAYEEAERLLETLK